MELKNESEGCRRIAAGVCLSSGGTAKALLACSLALALPMAATAKSHRYRVKVVARTDDRVAGRTLTGSQLAVIGFNHGGTLGFVSNFNGGNIGVFILSNFDTRRSEFRRSALVVQRGDTIGGKTLTDFVQLPRLSNAGTVAFAGNFPGGTGIFTPTALLAQVGGTIGGKTLTGLVAPPAINSSGTVAFRGRFSDGEGIFTPSNLLVKTGDTIGGKTITGFPGGLLPDFPRINDAGTILFSANFADPRCNQCGQGLFTPSGLLVQSGNTIAGKTMDYLGMSAINAANTVAFTASFNGGAGLFTQTSLLAQTGSVIGGRTFGSFFMTFPSINNDGGVAFTGIFDNELGVATPSEVLIRTGDRVGARTVRAIGDAFISGAGMVAFSVSLGPNDQPGVTDSGAILVAVPR